MTLNRDWLRPLPAHAILQDPDWHIWGGGMVRTSDGVCHLLVARWERRHGFPAWVTHSEIAYASAPDPTGPYTIQGTALGRREPGFWDSDNAHNPMILAHGGRFYLYYTGNTGDGDWWTHRNHQRIGVAVADHPAGPWRRSDVPLVDVTPGSWDHQITSSPIVTRGGDGRFYMVYKGVSDGPQPFGGQVRMGLAIADEPQGPFVKQPGNFFDAPGVKFPSDDNFIWFADGKFHAIVKDYGGNFQSQAREALVLFHSSDGRHWTLDGADPVLSLFELRWADGRITRPLARLDQPQIGFDDDGRPAVLFLAVKEHRDDDNRDCSFNVQVPLSDPVAG